MVDFPDSPDPVPQKGLYFHVIRVYDVDFFPKTVDIVFMRTSRSDHVRPSYEKGKETHAHQYLFPPASDIHHPSMSPSSLASEPNSLGLASLISPNFRTSKKEENREISYKKTFSLTQ